MDFDKIAKEISEEYDYPIEGVKKFFDEVGRMEDDLKGKGE